MINVITGRQVDNLQNEIIDNQKKYINNYSARDLVELIKENF